LTVLSIHRLALSKSCLKNRVLNIDVDDDCDDDSDELFDECSVVVVVVVDYGAVVTVSDLLGESFELYRLSPAKCACISYIPGLAGTFNPSKMYFPVASVVVLLVIAIVELAVDIIIVFELSGALEAARSLREP
jgi:hypothetical protein